MVFSRDFTCYVFAYSSYAARILRKHTMGNSIKIHLAATFLRARARRNVSQAYSCPRWEAEITR